MKDKFHLIGIKGSGMSALAHILHDMGHEVQGSDLPERMFTQIGLEAKGMALYPFGQSKIEPDMKVIIGNAFKDDHEEVLQAKNAGAKTIRYHQFLGELIEGATSIAVSGTHGKTTTTGLLSHVLRLNHPTSFLIGDGTGKGVKDGKYFSFEACEYKRHFLAYHPDYAIITNIEHDHPDYFADLDDVLSAFDAFAAQTKKQVVACGDDPAVLALKDLSKVMTYGFGDGNRVVAKNILKNSKGTAFDVWIDAKFYHTFETPFFGDHMVLNSLAVIAVCFLEGMESSVVEKDLALFAGVKRRFAEKKYLHQVIIDDYAHHPTEIAVTLKAVRQKYPDKELVAVFQPHTFTRTKTFIDEFSESLNLADHVYLTDIFGSARETGGEVSIDSLIEKCRNGVLVTEENIGMLSKHTEGVLVFMGAGDIKKYEEAYYRQA
ncbi:MAG: UDP-N-acetylmuramate--L-alanine ligase [Turicibacter sp.]|nr:UDP-N-acetylmuramate--L-alanine ligase [Turicibacter sp.]